MRVAIILFVFGLTIILASAANAETLIGVVLSEAGTPAPHATINAAVIFKSPPWRMTVKSDEQGKFQIDLPKINGYQIYSLAVRWNSEGLEVLNGLDQTGKTVNLQGQKLPPLVIRLRSEGRLRGKLLQEEDGKPIAEGKLFLDTGEVLTTDKDGVFQVKGLPMRDHSLIPVASGRVRKYILFDTTRRPDAELELRLPRGAIIKGTVVDERGNPVPTARVQRSSSGTALTLNGWDESCGKDGSFEYGGLSGQRLFYGLELTAPGYESQPLTVEVRDPNEVFERKITLRKSTESDDTAPQQEPTKQRVVDASVELPRRTIEGKVQDENGKPVKDAAIRWGAFLWDSSVKSTTSDENGRYRLPRAPDTPGAVLVVAKGFAPQFVPAFRADNRVDIQLARGAAVRGVVVGSSGVPIAGVKIIPVTHCLDTGLCNPIWLSELEVETNLRGEFEIPSMPSAGMTFEILKSGYSDNRNVVLEPGVTDHQVQLSAGGALGGTVVDPQGKPVRQFNIRVEIPRSLQPGEPAGGYYAGFDWYGINFTRDDGTFIFTDVGAKTWLRIVVTSPGIGRATIDRVQTESLDELSPLDNLKIQLAPFVPLSVHVESAETGKPVVDAMVGLRDDDGRNQLFNWGSDDLWLTRIRSNAQGDATFNEPTGDEGRIVVSAPGFARQRIGWTDGAKQITVALQEEAQVEGDVRLNGKPVKEGYLRLSNADNDFFSYDLSTTDGRFTIDRLPAGQYTIEVSNNNGQSLYSSKMSLEAGTAVTEMIELKAAK